MTTQRNSRKGFVLVSALVILASLTLVVVTVAYRNMTNELMSANQRDSIEALTIAESGIETGFALVRRDYVKKRKFLVDDLTPYISSPIAAETLSDGNFAVHTPQVDQNYLVMNALGSTNGAEREIEIVLEINATATSQYAILTEDDIAALEGQPEIAGPFANIHSNSDIFIQGTPNVGGIVSASGTVTSTGNPDLGGEVSGAATVEIPHVYPPEYRQFATIIFTADCRVETPGGSVIADLSSGSTWHGWRCSVNTKWTFSGNVAADLFEAFYYVEGNVSLEGNPNALWHLSVVAEGNIQVSGNGEYQPWGSKSGNFTGDHSADEVLFLAGNDLVVVGNPDQNINGILAAHMEVHLSGNPYMTGSIVAENGRHGMGQEVTTGQQVVDLVTVNSIEGSMYMDASGTASLGGANPVKVTAWRELVH